MIAVAAGYSVWEALAVTIGGIVGAVGILTALTKIPGSRWVFRRLIRDPAREWLANENEFLAQKAAEEAADTRYERFATAIGQINEAVNNVAPGQPKLKDRVGNLEDGQHEMKGELKVIRNIVESLVRRS
jgi:hypothetical protein